jgi:hypothetical protein
VISKDAQPGEMVSPISAGGGFTRTGIATIVDMDSREIEVDVNEAYINRVHDEPARRGVLDAYPDWKMPGRVISIVPTADRQKATVRVRIAFERSIRGSCRTWASRCASSRTRRARPEAGRRSCRRGRRHATATTPSSGSCVTAASSAAVKRRAGDRGSGRRTRRPAGGDVSS